jgi:hypothetical protein
MEYVARGKSRRKAGTSHKSSGKRKSYRKVIKEGRRRRSKNAKLQCQVCGRWFVSLSEVNQHYAAAGHQRRRHPKKAKLPLDDLDKREQEIAKAIYLALKDPKGMRRLVREKLRKRLERVERYERGY